MIPWGNMNGTLSLAATNVLVFINRIIKQYGARVSGTNGNANAVDAISDELSQYCDSIRIEDFDIHPDSLFSIGKLFSIACVLGICAVFINSLPVVAICVLAMSLCIAYCISQFILYSDLFDRFFKKATGKNIIGLQELKGKAERQVILVGHHNSSYIYPFHEKHALLFPFRLFIPILLFFFEYGLLIVKLLSASSENQSWQQYACLVGLVFVLPMFRYISKKEV